MDTYKVTLSKMTDKKKYIYSDAQSDLLGTWFIAIVLSLFSYPIINVGFEKVDNFGLHMLLALFPLLAGLFIYFSLRDTFSWLRYGKTPLLLDPPIGAIGGDIGGTIFLNSTYTSEDIFKVVLTNIYSITTKRYDSSRKSYKTHTEEEILWEDEGYASVVTATKNSTLQFRFAIPEGLKASRSFMNQSYYWQVLVSYGNTSNTFTRSFIIPVKASSNTSKRLSIESNATLPKGLEKMTAFTLLPLSKTPTGHEIHYPKFSHKLSIQGFGIFGGIFVFVGLSMLLFGDGFAGFVGTILGMFGTGIVSYGLYDFLMETTISYDDTEIRSKRYLLGIPMKERALILDDKTKISYYNIFRRPIKKHGIEKFSFLVVHREGQHIILAKYIESIKAQKILKRYFEKSLQT